jgi:hypothetical protein
MEDRQQECRRLAAARTGAAEYVAPGHRRRDRLALDARGPYESEIPDRAQQIGVKSK